MTILRKDLALLAVSTAMPDFVLIRNKGETLSLGIALIITLSALTGHNIESSSCGSSTTCIAPAFCIVLEHVITICAPGAPH